MKIYEAYKEENNKNGKAEYCVCSLGMTSLALNPEEYQKKRDKKFETSFYGNVRLRFVGKLKILYENKQQKVTAI
jgi:hypothetical protein